MKNAKAKRKIRPQRPTKVLPCPKCGKDAEYNSYRGNGDFVGYFCRDNVGATGCGHHWEIKPSRAVRAFLKAKSKEMFRHSGAIHKTWHAFCKEFGSKEGRGWRLKGYEFMEAVEEWVKDHPEVQVVTVDDDHHTSSSLVLVPHFDKRQKDYWGTSVVYIAQCSGDDPISFFLYPGHLEGLQDAFKALRMFAISRGLRRGIP